MALRKSPQLTPELVAASRGNAQLSTGPRTAAGQQQSKLNALKHGFYSATENERAVMLALGEDPNEFEFLRLELGAAYGPGDALWKRQVDDLARLYWRRTRLERARGALLRKALLDWEEGQRRRRQEMAGATFGPAQCGVEDLMADEPADTQVRLRRLISTLGVLRAHLAQALAPSLPAHVQAIVQSLYQGRMGWRTGRIYRLLSLCCAGQPALAPAQCQEFLRLLDEEIASAQQDFAEAEKAYAERAALERDACLAPEGETSRTLLRQENALDRAIDRKVRILLRLCKEHSDDRVLASLASDEDDPEMQEINAILDFDLAPEMPAATAKSPERSGNVTENKGTGSRGNGKS